MSSSSFLKSVDRKEELKLKRNLSIHKQINEQKINEKKKKKKKRLKRKKKERKKSHRKQNVSCYFGSRLQRSIC